MSSSYQDDWEYRKFILNLGKKLKKEDASEIRYLEELSEEVEDREPWKVLKELEMSGRISMNNHETLIKILQTIERQDLVKKVMIFAKDQKRMCQTEHNDESEIITLSSTIRRQLETFKRLAQVEGNIEIENGVADMITTQKSVHKWLVELNMQRQGKRMPILLLSSTPSSAARSSTDGSRNSSEWVIIQNSPTTSTISTSSGGFLMKSDCRQQPVAAGLPKSPMIPKLQGNPKPPHKGRIPQSKMPILPPVLNIETGLPAKNRTFSEPCIDPSNNGALERWVKNPSKPVNTKLPGSQTERTYPFEPGSNRMVKLSVGKPIPPPKPKKWKQHAGVGNGDINEASVDDYSDPSSYSAGDSGFADCHAFLRKSGTLHYSEPLSPHESDEDYTDLRIKELDQSHYYKTPNQLGFEQFRKK